MKRLFDTADLEAELFEGANFGDEDNFDMDITFEEAKELPVSFTEEDLEEFPVLEFSLELADGRTLDYEAVGVFIHGEKEYMALHPKTDTEGMVHLMELSQGEDDEIQLNPVGDDVFEAVAETFHRLFIDEME